MEKKVNFNSTTAEVKSLILQCVANENRDFERKELVDYVYGGVDDVSKLTDGIVAGAIKILTCSGELVVVKRGIYKKGSGKQKATSFEKIYNVCNRFTADLERACNLNLLTMTDEEKKVCPEFVEVLELGRANISEFMDSMENLMKEIWGAEMEGGTENMEVSAIETESVAVEERTKMGVVEPLADGLKSGAVQSDKPDGKKNQKHKEKQSVA